MFHNPVALALVVIAGLSIAAIVFASILFRSIRRNDNERLHLISAMDHATEQRTAAVAELAASSDELQKLREKVLFYADRFRPVTNLDDEITRLKHEISDQIHKLADVKSFCETKTKELQDAYAEKKKIYDALVRQVAIFDERLALAEMGVYEPHFDFSDSEAYKSAINANRAQQKALISVNSAVLCLTQWHVDGSLAQGKKMTARNIKLTLRAFNNECDAAVANCRWNNVNAMEKRIERPHEQIDKLNEPNKIVITKKIVELKLRELYLTHEYREKLKAEREERAEKARAAREEQKLLRDIERAEEDEAHYEGLLRNARAEAEQAIGPRLAVFQEKIAILEKDLAAAHEKTVRAQAMAEKTRSGWVYIISNIGSFGEGVVKIGLTRRLDPMDRVRELGDASVPFIFDTHAMIYSDDAVSLERSLHARFEDTRLNMQNNRKEFFRANIDEVEKAVKSLSPSAPFFKDIEAQDFRETMARRNAKLTQQMEQLEPLPEAI